MDALITGDTGFIGSNMKGFLQNEGVNVIGYSKSKGLDVFNIPNLDEYVGRSDMVMHFAAEAKPGESINHPVETIDVNIKGTLNVLEACRKHDKPLIYPSSCEIYGDSLTPIDEDFPFKPTNPYSASKVAGDRFCYTYYKAYKLDVKMIRFFNPYGPHQQLNKIIPTFYRQAIKGDPITVFNDGSDIRDYVFVDDIVNGMWMARDLSPGEAVNLATGVATTNLEVAKKVIQMTDSSSDINFVEYPREFGGIANQVGSNQKAEKLMGWRPKFDFDMGLSHTLTWLEGVYKDE